MDGYMREIFTNEKCFSFYRYVYIFFVCLYVRVRENGYALVSKQK